MRASWRRLRARASALEQRLDARRERAPLVAARDPDRPAPEKPTAICVGVSGAGRVAKPRTHFSETAESFRAYAVAGRHRHTPEIEQELSAAAGVDVRVVFSPHLVPMIRGILATAYVSPTPGVDAQACTQAARELYAGSPAVVVLEPGECPDTQWARGANRAFLSYTQDERSGVIVAQCAIDNLVKGAAGQAVQAMNVRFGLDEGAGLSQPAMWP